MEVVAKAEVLLLTANVAEEEQVKKYVDDTVSRFGQIDGFFNNAGVEGKQDLTEDFGSNEFQKVVSINLNGVFFGMKYVLAVMKKQGSGSIVKTASVGGIRGVGNLSGYAASKHGVVGDNWEEVGKEFVQPNLMKRCGKPEEVGYLVAFLLSDQANFINAAVVQIDGG